MTTMARADDFTPTQQRILAVLRDGRAHLRSELLACLWDELGARSNIRAHLTAIRKVLRTRGEDIRCEILDRAVYYRRIRVRRP